MRRSLPLSLLSLFLAATLSGQPAPADVAPADFREQASEKVWAEHLRPGAFQDRPIAEGAAQNVIELKAPYRAEDAAIVPISVHTRMPQSAERYIRRIHIYIDKNPLPLVGIFEFTPASGRADVAMRVRVDDFSFVRAIAELNTGELYMAKSFVRATGACSAPPPKSIDDSIAHMGAMKLRTVGDFALEEPNLVQLMIKHPNITGLQPLRIGSRVRPPAHFIRELSVAYNGEPVMHAQLTFGVSMDPSLRFYFVPEASGTLTVTALDTQNNRWSVSEAMPPAGGGQTAG
jgi:sulfur-oxidizing protein SoxY